MLGKFTYLAFELGWAVPVLVVQWAVGCRVLWRYRLALLFAVAVPTVYLAGADSFAIASGIWSLHRSRITGLYIGNLPIEELIFFLLTNAMVVQTVALVGAGWTEVVQWPRRAATLVGRILGERHAREPAESSQS